MAKPAPDFKSIFAHAFELDSPDERERYLADACRGDAGLRGQVEQLLQGFAPGGVPADSHVFSTMTPEERQAAPVPSPVIDAYKLLEQIGEGGMGVVYLAEQTRPIHRKVALKIIKPGMGSRQVIARFEAERQALALMDHPNIAKVFDAGSTKAGRPYFVMELVKGIPITDYCDRAALSPRERIELFVTVCHAIQHAHQKGIIHRDIKPSNVLVSLYDGKPVCKVIDFGVAKAIDQRLTDHTLFTHHGAIVGTLEYMSPEQAENSALDIDTRSDVYSLGVLLYELMTGTTPLERRRTRQAASSEVLRRIREEEPPRPSSRLSKTDELAAIAANRNMEPAKLARLVRGELDWIAMKALDKDRNRRYASAGDLARDLERYLAGETVEAGAPTASYRLRKYVRKHFIALATASAFAALLVAGTAVSTWLAIRAVRQETKARHATEDANAVLEFFRKKILAAARPKGPDGGLGREVTLREAVEKAEPSIATDFANRPKVEASIRDELGTTYQYLGDFDAAARQHERARALRLAVLGPHDKETLTSMDFLAVSYRQGGRPELAIPLLEKVLACRKNLLAPDDPDVLLTMNDLAEAYKKAERVDEAIPLLEQVVEQSKKRRGPEHRETLISMDNLAMAYKIVGRVNEAVPLLEKVLATLQATLGPDDPDTLVSANNVAESYRVVGRLAEAIPRLEGLLARRRKILAPEHPETLITMSSLALAYRDAGRTDPSIRLFQELLGLRRRKPGRDRPATLKTMNDLARVYLMADRWADAEVLLRECLELRTKSTRDEWRRFHTMSQLGAALAGQRKYAEAESMLVDGYQGLLASEAKIPHAAKRDLTDAAARIAPFYEAWGKPEQATEWRHKLPPQANGKQSAPSIAAQASPGAKGKISEPSNAPQPSPGAKGKVSEP